MEKTAENPFGRWKLYQVGAAVWDVDKAVKRLSTIGIGPWRPYHTADTPRMVDREFHGKPVDYKHKMLLTKIGELDFELLQPADEGPGPLREFLESKGEGLHHLAFWVENLEEEISRLTREGFEIVASGKNSTGKVGFVFVQLMNGVFLELVEAGRTVQPMG